MSERGRPTLSPARLQWIAERSFSDSLLKHTLARIGDDRPQARDLAMDDAPLIPLEMQRRFERRWAARFAAPVEHLNYLELHGKKTVNADGPQPVRIAAERPYGRRF